LFQTAAAAVEGVSMSLGSLEVDADRMRSQVGQMGVEPNHDQDLINRVLSEFELVVGTT
jgi:hypothetical protein